jgi:integrase
MLFESKEGTLVDARIANGILKRSLRQLGIEGISTHSLRHTFGTRSVESGMRAVALQRLMGHKDVSVTLNTYTTVFNKYKESELEKLNNYYMENSFFNDELVELLEEKREDNDQNER